MNTLGQHRAISGVRQDPTFRDFIHSTSQKFRNRIALIHDEFCYAGYTWKFVEDKLNKSTRTATYKLSPLKDLPTPVNLLDKRALMNKTNQYRQHLEMMFSMFYDYTMLDLKIQFVGDGEFYVSLNYVEGEEFDNKLMRVYRRLSGNSAYPLVTATDSFNGTVFPLSGYFQFSNCVTLEKGLLLCQYRLDPVGNPTSMHYAKDAFINGIPIISLVLTTTEYKDLKKYCEVVGYYDMISDFKVIANVLGADDSNIGSLLLWLGLLVDEQNEMECWTFNQAFDTINSITCVRRARINVVGEDQLVIEIHSSVVGVLSEGIEAILLFNPTSRQDELDFDIEFVNGYENDKTHKENLQYYKHIVFDNLMSDMCTFGWKLGNTIADPFAGYMSVLDDAIVSESESKTDYVRRASYKCRFHSYFFCPTKGFARYFKFKRYHKKLFGGRVSLDKLMYPIKSSDDLILFKSYGKMKNAKKYRYVALLNTKDYDSYKDGFEAFASLFKYRGNTLRFNDPSNNELVMSMVNNFISPFIDATSNKVRCSFVGSRIIVLENVGDEL